MIDAFREAGGEGKPVVVQIKVAWADDDDQALAATHDQWRTNVFASALMADIETIDQFEIAAAHVRPEDLHASVLVSSDPARHAAGLHELVELGVDEIYVHQVPKDQDGFLDVYAEKVLPEIQDSQSGQDGQDGQDRRGDRDDRRGREAQA
jgi:alkanesulfonate monooxygenase SsuD/methylene tetrahydromethanopterin reductase-like flavin-dependent oxidoreductase (luciferase family)